MQIGKYPVVARLGEGATSEVFLARDEFRGVDVAVKRWEDFTGQKATREELKVAA